MLKKKDYELLEEAYISISKKTPDIHTSSTKVSTDPNEVVDVGSMDEPAPGVDMNMIDSEVEDVEPEDKDTTGVPVSMTMDGSSEDCGCHSEEDEQAEMAIDNLNSIRESIMKIASFCGTGGNLEAWAHQKLAIAMDNLAGIARSLH
jgi:hypothetical protein